MQATLHQLKPTRNRHTISLKHISSITGIPVKRLKHLETLDDYERGEPWFDEAIAIAHILTAGRILPLMQPSTEVSGYLTDFDLGIDVGADLPAHHSGKRLPLSVACRLAIKLGLSDPCELNTPHTLLQLWDTINANERHPEAAGWCPWCTADIMGGEPHSELCLGHNLLHRDPAEAKKVLGALLPENRPGGRGSSGIGHGLRALRQSLDDGRGVTQRQIAEAVGVETNYYARIERGSSRLNVRVAERIAQHFGVDVNELYRKPAVSPAVPPPPTLPTPPTPPAPSEGATQ